MAFSGLFKTWIFFKWTLRTEKVQHAKVPICCNTFRNTVSAWLIQHTLLSVSSMVLHCLFSWPFHEMRTITVTSVLQVWSQAYPSWFIQWQNWNSGHLLSSFLTPNTPTSNHPLWSSHYVAFQTAEPKQCACIRPGSKKQILKNGTLSQFFFERQRERNRDRDRRVFPYTDSPSKYLQRPSGGPG